MTRPSHLCIDAAALSHNVARVRQYAPQQSVIAMVKANAYGCALNLVAPILEPLVDSFGVACIEEARALRQYCPQKDCILFQGIFDPKEITTVVALHLTVVIHNPQQLAWFTTTPLSKKLNVWVKVDTGMHRLGFAPHELAGVMSTLKVCPWIDDDIGLMTHMACADTPSEPACLEQVRTWQSIADQDATLTRSASNSAAIVALPETHADAVRPGLMLYGVSPFSDRLGSDLGLQPVMQFVSSITTIHEYATGEAIGYGATWRCERPSVIGVIPVGYGDGYPQHLRPNTPVCVNGYKVPVVGRVSMDMLTIDLTDCPNVKLGDQVELWGKDVPIEVVAKHANTSVYELMPHVAQRVGRQYLR
ncbi:MAG: alanine racemase [Gammaproteobacteria bacterium]|nr:alanine racemase [Gammaproteobacteria bacterium]